MRAVSNVITHHIPQPLLVRQLFAVGIVAIDDNEAASAACRPIDDKRGTKVYRVKVAGVMARRAAEIARDRARSG